MTTPSIPEVSVFHPLVAQWLEDNGYSYNHHWEMPLNGVADFRATKDGYTFFVECKSHEDARQPKSIRQLLSYTVQVPGSKGIFVVPSFLYDEDVEYTCKEFGLMYIAVEAMPSIEAIKSQTEPSFEETIAQFFAYTDSCRYNPEGVLIEIVHAHQVKRTSPILDIEFARRRGEDFQRALTPKNHWRINVVIAHWLQVIVGFLKKHPEYAQEWLDLYRAMEAGSRSTKRHYTRYTILLRDTPLNKPLPKPEQPPLLSAKNNYAREDEP